MQVTKFQFLLIAAQMEIAADQSAAADKKRPPILQQMRQDASSTFRNIKEFARQRMNSKKPIFGQPLQEVPGINGIPFIVQQIVEYLTENHLSLEGIFRVPGSQVEIKNLKSAFDQGAKHVDFADLDIVKTPHSVSALLKMFLRELPDPLLTYEYYDCFIASNTIDQHEAKMSCIKKVINYLPQRNKNLLFYLMIFLFMVSQKSDLNKMTSVNLAIVFAPNLLRAKEMDMMALADNSSATQVIDAMIKHFDEIFDDAQILPIKDESNESSAPPSSGEEESLSLETTATSPISLNLSKAFQEKQSALVDSVSYQLKKFNLKIREQMNRRKSSGVDEKTKKFDEVVVIDSANGSFEVIHGQIGANIVTKTPSRPAGPRPSPFS